MLEYVSDQNKAGFTSQQCLKYMMLKRKAIEDAQRYYTKITFEMKPALLKVVW